MHSSVTGKSFEIYLLCNFPQIRSAVSGYKGQEIIPTISTSIFNHDDIYMARYFGDNRLVNYIYVPLLYICTSFTSLGKIELCILVGLVKVTYVHLLPHLDSSDFLTESTFCCLSVLAPYHLPDLLFIESLNADAKTIRIL